MKRKLALLLAVMMIITMFSACSSSTESTEATESAETSTPDESVAPTETPTEIRHNNGDPFYGEDNITLTVWVSDSVVEITEEMCDNFLELHPDKTITIDVESHEEGDIDYELTTNSGNGADVFSFGCDQLRALKESGVIAPVVSDYWEDITTYHSDHSVSSAMLDGQLMAYPETEPYSYYLVYDKSCVSDTYAQTLEGVLEACRKSGKKFVMDASNGYYGCVFPFTGGLSVEGFSEEGAQVFNNYEENNILDSLVAFATLFNEYSDVIQNDTVDTIGIGMSGDGSVAAGIDGYWNMPAIKENLGDRFGAAKLPSVTISGTEMQMVSVCGSRLLGVNKKSRFPEAAQVLADYLAGYDCQNTRLTEMYWLPSIKELQASEAVTGNAGLEALLAQSQYCVYQTLISPTFWEPMGSLGSTVMSGNTDRTELKTQFDQAITQTNSNYN